MHNNVSVLWCDIVVGVTGSMTDAVNVDEVTSHSEQDTREEEGGR